mmetsp:Transcript_37969/g.95448  ORF Transcript_37969/g.95448 Transcript_37969/m.95448 type:complete len:330 (-) Transcript_37969:196-1185(-)
MTEVDCHGCHTKSLQVGPARPVTFADSCLDINLLVLHHLLQRHGAAEAGRAKHQHGRQWRQRRLHAPEVQEHRQHAVAVRVGHRHHLARRFDELHHLDTALALTAPLARPLSGGLSRLGRLASGRTALAWHGAAACAANIGGPVAAAAPHADGRDLPQRDHLCRRGRVKAQVALCDVQSAAGWVLSARATFVQRARVQATQQFALWQHGLEALLEHAALAREFYGPQRLGEKAAAHKDGPHYVPHLPQELEQVQRLVAVWKVREEVFAAGDDLYRIWHHQGGVLAGYQGDVLKLDDFCDLPSGKAEEAHVALEDVQHALQGRAAMCVVA